MEGVQQAIEDAERAQEERDVAELDRCIEGIKVLSRIFKKYATSEELAAAEGRRCVLSIVGLKYTQKAYYFQVTGSTIDVVQPYSNYNTLISAPIDSVIRVLKGVASGNKFAFSEEHARGKAVIKGTRSLHDAYAFAEAFKRFATLAGRYGPIQL